MSSSWQPTEQNYEPGGQGNWRQILRRLPLVSVVLVLCLLLAVGSRLGDSLAVLAPFTFSQLVFEAGQLYALPLEYGLQQGQYWRLLTPVFLHFGLMHLIMNSVWFWELGRRIEMHQGSWFMLLLFVFSGVFSNYVQYWFSGPSLFGGLSGVLYALLGFCWIYQLLRPVAAYRLPKGVVGLMLGWLLLCLSGVVTALGFGQIANAAHISGLLLGCAAGAGSALFDRVRAL